MQVGERTELGTGVSLGGGASQAGMVNTVKLLLMSQQSGLDVGEQEGHRTPFGTEGSLHPTPPCHLPFTGPSQGWCCARGCWAFPQEILLCGIAGSSVGSSHHWVGTRVAKRES